MYNISIKYGSCMICNCIVILFSFRILYQIKLDLFLKFIYTSAWNILLSIIYLKKIRYHAILNKAFCVRYLLVKI